MTNIFLFLLITIFAMSSWLDMNALWVQVPIMVEVLPEGWTLPSIIVLTIQVANVGPFLFYIFRFRLNECVVVCLIILVAIISCCLLAPFWDTVYTFAGSERSIPLISLSFLLSLVDCTSSLAYLPYISSFDTSYVSALFVGEGLSGVVPALVGVVQGVGFNDNGGGVNSSSDVTDDDVTLINLLEQNVTVTKKEMRFGVDIFFVIISFLLLLSLISFLLIHFAPYFKQFKIQNGRQNTNKTSSNIATNKKPLSTLQRIILLLMVTWVNGLTNGVLPSIQSYACIPYGHMIYNLSTKLSILVSPLTSLTILFLPSPNMAVLYSLNLIGSFTTAYQISLAVMSPYPPLKHQPIGGILVTASCVVTSICFSYVKVGVASMMVERCGDDKDGGGYNDDNKINNNEINNNNNNNNNHRTNNINNNSDIDNSNRNKKLKIVFGKPEESKNSNKKESRWREMVNCGVATQVGSLIGALTSFVLVNVCHVFKS